MARFAKYTKVPIAQTRAEIEKTLAKYGAKSFMSGQTSTEAIVAFEAKDRRVMFRLPLPKEQNQEKFDRECRRRWRALLLCIRAKLEAVASEIATFEDEFLAYIQMPDGMTVGDHVKPKIATSYKENKMLPFFGEKKS